MITQSYEKRLSKVQCIDARGRTRCAAAQPSRPTCSTSPATAACAAYAMITQDGKVALGVPSTDVEDVKRLARFDHLVGFEDEVGIDSTPSPTTSSTSASAGLGGAGIHLPHAVHDGHDDSSTRQAEGCGARRLHPHLVLGCGWSRNPRRSSASAQRQKWRQPAWPPAVAAVKPGVTKASGRGGRVRLRHAGAEEFWRNLRRVRPAHQISLTACRPTKKTSSKTGDW